MQFLNKLLCTKSIQILKVVFYNILNELKAN